MPLDICRLTRDTLLFPPEVLHVLEGYPEGIAAIGDSTILLKPLLGLFCSAKCPASLILKAHDFCKVLRERGIAVISGFHSPVEEECLEVLIRGKQPLIACPARSLEGIRIPKPWRAAISEQRLLALTPFPEKEHRKRKDLALLRNRFVAYLSAAILIIHAEPSSQTFALAQELIAADKIVWTFDHPSNISLVQQGAKPMVESNSEFQLQRVTTSWPSD